MEDGRNTINEAVNKPKQFYKKNMILRFHQTRCWTHVSICQARISSTTYCSMNGEKNEADKTIITPSSRPTLSKGIKLVPHSRSLKVWQVMAQNMKQKETIKQPQIVETPANLNQPPAKINENVSLPKGIRLVPHSRSLKLWNVMAQNIKDISKKK